MRREEKGFRFIILIFAVIAVIISLLIGLLISRGVKNSRQNEFARQISKSSEELSETDTASTKIGKSVEEAEGKVNEDVEEEKGQQGFEIPTTTDVEDKTNSSNNKIAENNSANETKNVTTNEKNENETKNVATNGKNENETKNVATNGKNENETKNNTIETNSENNKKIKKETEQKEEKIELEVPIKGVILREFAKDSLVFSNTLQEWVTHNGIDIKADKTSVVKSAAKGTVSAIKNDPRYGLTVIINHDNGYQTIYSNLLTAEFVVKGEKVEKGQSVGTVGNSASFEIEDEYHLHFELLKDNEHLDPRQFMNF